MDERWSRALRDVVSDRDVIIAGAVPAAWSETIEHLRGADARRLLIVATEGAGTRPGPDVPTVVATPPTGLGLMQRLRWGTALLQDPPPDVRAAIDDFDPDRTAIVIGTFLNESSHLAGRPFLAHRRPEWVALEDKTVIDDLWQRAGVDHLPSAVVAIEAAADAARSIDLGCGTVWAADATNGYHGGAHGTRWVDDDATGRVAEQELREFASRVRIMPFVDGIPCAIHGIVLPDGVAAVRPVEMVTLRRDRELVYAGCASFWDPKPAVRDAMREAARRVGHTLADEVDFRGVFTIDGVVDGDGFWPTELNPRLGTGLITITSGNEGIPISLLNELVVAGGDVGATVAELETELVDHADDHRSGGTWRMADGITADHVDRPVCCDDLGWHWQLDTPVDGSDGRLTCGNGFARCVFDPDRTPVGTTVGERAAAFWRFAAAELGSDLGLLTAAPDVQ